MSDLDPEFINKVILGEKFNGLDPRDALFSLVLNNSLENQFYIYSHIKSHWFDISRHKSLYKCLKYHVENSIHMDMLTAAHWFRDNAAFETNFTVVDLTGLTQKYNSWSITSFNAAIHGCLFLYIYQKAYRLHLDLSRLMNYHTFDLELFEKKITDFIKMDELERGDFDDRSNLELIDEVLQQHDNAADGKLPGIELGFTSLSHLLLEDVDFMVVGARPSMGKTAFLLSAVYLSIFKMNYTVELFSLEMSKVQFIRRLISIGTGIPSEQIKLGRLTHEQKEVIQAFKKRPEWNNLKIYEGAHKASDIVRKVSVSATQRKIDWVGVDYLQKCSHEKQGMQIRDHVSLVSNTLKNLSMNLKIPVIALAQLSRSVETRGGDKKPVLSDLRESGEIEQDASVVAFLHRPEYYGITVDESGESTECVGEFILAKYREGKIQSTRMHVDNGTMRWMDLPTNRPLLPNTSFDTKKNDKKNDDLPF